MPNHLRQIGPMLVALIGIAAIAVLGGMLGQFLEPSKAFFLIVAAVAIWALTGWLVGGWRSELAGLMALGAALAALEGSHALAVMFSCMAFVFLFTPIPMTR